jgi:hypothetical protein
MFLFQPTMVPVASRIVPFGDVVVDAIQPEEIGGGHPRLGEDVGTGVVTVRHPANQFDQETQENMAAIAIAASPSGREAGGLLTNRGKTSRVSTTE